MNLRFDLKEGAASPDEWRCEAVCKEIKEAATAPTKQKAKKKAAAQVLERLGETEWPNGDPICALGSRASLSFDKVSGKRQWVCAASLTKDSQPFNATAAGSSGSASSGREAAAAADRAISARTTTSDAGSYVGASRGASTPTSKVMLRTARTATCARAVVENLKLC